MLLDNGLLTLDEAAPRLRIHRGTLRAWAKAGRVPYIRTGRKWLFAPADLQRFVETCRVPSRDNDGPRAA